MTHFCPVIPTSVTIANTLLPIIVTKIFPILSMDRDNKTLLLRKFGTICTEFLTAPGIAKPWIVNRNGLSFVTSQLNPF